eukprot:1149530-Rhodomonas_salina.1
MEQHMARLKVYLPTEPYAMSGTDRAYASAGACAVLTQRMMVPAVCAIGLRASDEMSGTDVGYGSTRRLILTYARSGTHAAHGPTRLVSSPTVRNPIQETAFLRTVLPASHAILLRAVSGTDLAYGAVGLRACYAMSGTDIAYGATRLHLSPPLPPLSLLQQNQRRSYSPPIVLPTLLWSVQYCQMSGTDRGFPCYDMPSTDRVCPRVRWYQEEYVEEFTDIPGRAPLSAYARAPLPAYALAMKRPVLTCGMVLPDLQSDGLIDGLQD